MILRDINLHVPDSRQQRVSAIQIVYAVPALIISILVIHRHFIQLNDFFFTMNFISYAQAVFMEMGA